MLEFSPLPSSSRGPGRSPFKAKTGVRIPVRAQEASRLTAGFLLSPGWRKSICTIDLQAGLALRHQAILVHKDPEIAALAETVQLEALPYKRN